MGRYVGHGQVHRDELATQPSLNPVILKQAVQSVAFEPGGKPGEVVSGYKM